MKNKKFKGLIAALFALAMAVSVGTTLSVARVQKHPEIVLAEEADPETPDSSEGEEPAEGEETPATDGSEAKEESEESAQQVTPISSSEIVKLLIQSFKDAIKDLINHFKRWLHFFK